MIATTFSLIAVLADLPLHGVSSQQATKYAFLNVNVVPMNREVVLSHQTVLIEGDRIKFIGDASKIKIPVGSVEIDGRGKYLIPGLMDMHTHLFSDDEFPKEMAGDELKVMIANGVTTIRLMLGTPEHLKYRSQVEEGKMIGPTLFVASPGLTGRPQSAESNGRLATTPEAAKSAVEEFKRAGYDFIKFVDGFVQPYYDAAIKAAKEQGIRVVGHVDPSTGVAHALKQKQNLEHFDAYMESVLKDDSPIKVSVSDRNVYRKDNWVSLDYVDDEKVKAIAKATAESGTYTTPTLNFFKSVVVEGETEEQIRSRPDFLFTPKKNSARLFPALKRINEIRPSIERRQRYQQIRDTLTVLILRNGGKIMAGSDSPDAFHVYGFALHRELKALKAAGLTNYEVLSAATRVPAEFLKVDKKFGTIKAGLRADLVLLDENPLADISATEKRTGVMVRGNWFPESVLTQWLDEIGKRFSAVP